MYNDKRRSVGTINTDAKTCVFRLYSLTRIIF